MMRIALVIQEYFPHGGLQRDFSRLLRVLVTRGHRCTVYCARWQGERVGEADLRILPVRALTNHGRAAAFARRVQESLYAQDVDRVVGFNRMPGLDIYFAGDGSFVDRAAHQPGLYRALPRYRTYAALERAVFEPQTRTQVLLLTAGQGEVYRRCHATPAGRLHVLPPGVDPSARAPADAQARRRAQRQSLGLEQGELALLFVASSFATKGLDRAITTLAHMAAEQPSVKARLIVVGAGRPRRFRRLAKKLGVLQALDFLGGRDDVDQLMLAADLLVHPARVEAGGAVLLEALAAGLPVVTSALCGYAEHVEDARAGIVLPVEFTQQMLDHAVMRNIDGVFRADRRESALAYAARTDLYGMHDRAADFIEQPLEGRD